MTLKPPLGKPGNLTGAFMVPVKPRPDPVPAHLVRLKLVELKIEWPRVCALDLHGTRALQKVC